MTIYLFPFDDTFSFISDKNLLSKENQDMLIEIESLPEGSGILKRDGEGVFYYEPYPEVEIVPEPEPFEPQPTLEDKIDDLISQVESDNLVTFEVLATMYEESGNNTMTSFEVMAEMYEEILLLREQVDQLTGGVQQ